MPDLFNKSVKEYYHWDEPGYADKAQNKAIKTWWKYLKSIKPDIKKARMTKDGWYCVTLNNGQTFKIRWLVPKEKQPPVFIK